MPILSASYIKQSALSLGFSACGIAHAGRVSSKEEAHLRQWLAESKHADMNWMANHLELRLDPRLIMPETKSIIVVAMNYAPARRLPDDEPQIAAYALGKDYHELVKQRLHRLAETIYGSEEDASGHYRAFVDSGPILERYWAQQAGLGWVGRNEQLIIPQAGTMHFLGELLVDFETDYDTPMPTRCGECRRCIDHCPTGALSDDQLFDARKCLSYQTIENRGALSPDARHAMGNCFYGCDRCQDACPWNRFAIPNTTPELQPSDELLAMTAGKWATLTEDDYRRLFKGSAVKRAKYAGIKRNLEAVLASKKP